MHADRWHHVRKTTNYIDTIKDPLQIADLSLRLPLACWGSKVRPFRGIQGPNAEEYGSLLIVMFGTPTAHRRLQITPTSLLTTPGCECEVKHHLPKSQTQLVKVGPSSRVLAGKRGTVNFANVARAPRVQRVAHTSWEFGGNTTETQTSFQGISLSVLRACLAN